VFQGFYRRFALHAAQRGYEVLTFDYRGIGKSKPATLRGFDMDYLDWARQDLAAAIDAMVGDDAPLYLVGHSYGGHALGLLPNWNKLRGAYVFAIGAGWHGYMPFSESLKVRVLWNFVLPPLTAWKGYLPWSLLGMGEDLPLDVYRKWRHWCRFPHYFFDDPRMRGIADVYAKVTIPIVFANALDDAWATPASRDAFVFAYRNAQVQTRDIDPKQLGTPIGHMGYFRQSAAPLWDEVLDSFAGIEEIRT
jgi:predicted alpha/beta hydrolase